MNIDVAKEALYRSIEIDHKGELDYSNTEKLLSGTDTPTSSTLNCMVRTYNNYIIM